MQRPCGCLAAGADLASVLFSRHAVPFDTLLETHAKLVAQTKQILGCPGCCADSQMPCAVLRIVARLLDYHEAAVSAYAAEDHDGNQQRILDHSPTSASASLQMQSVAPLPRALHHLARCSSASSVSSAPTQTPDQPQCVRSSVTLGELAMNQFEARLLAEQLVWESLVQLNGLLNDLKQMSDERLLLYPNGLQAVEDRLIAGIMDRTAKLTGQLRQR